MGDRDFSSLLYHFYSNRENPYVISNRENPYKFGWSETK